MSRGRGGERALGAARLGQVQGRSKRRRRRLSIDSPQDARASRGDERGGNFSLRARMDADKCYFWLRPVSRGMCCAGLWEPL